MVPSRGTVTGVARMALMRVVDMAFLLSRKARLIRNRFYCRKLVLPLDQLEREGLALVPRPRRIRRVPRPIARLSAMPFQSIEPRRLYRQIAEQIRTLIRAGEFKAGGRLPPERDLARQLGVSRPSVREAL